MKKVKILVIDDKIENLETAKEQFEGRNNFELITAQTFSEAKNLLKEEFNGSMYSKELSTKEEEGNFKNFNLAKDTLERVEKHQKMKLETYEKSTTYPDFDIVMTDLMMPSDEIGGTGEEIPSGLVLALLALKNKVPKIFLVSDTNRHNSPIAYALAGISGRRGQINIYCECPKKMGQKIGCVC